MIIPGKAKYDIRKARRRAEREALDAAIVESSGNIGKLAMLIGLERPSIYDLFRAHDGAKAAMDAQRDERRARKRR